MPKCVQEILADFFQLITKGLWNINGLMVTWKIITFGNRILKMSKNKVAVATPGFYSLHIPLKKKPFQNWN